MKLTYNFACRERPEKLFKCLENITSLARHEDYEIICTLDVDDSTICNPEVRDRIAQYSKVKSYFGISKSKIDAINKNICFATGDIILNHSDDMVFIKEGYDLDILEAFNGFKGLVHFPDQKVGKKLITYAMMHRDYLDLDGWIYNPEFDSVYADNFQQDLAKRRNKYKFVDKRILDHRHNRWGYGKPDALLQKTESADVYKKDRATYLRLLKELTA
jgi:hypothetical protein